MIEPTGYTALDLIGFTDKGGYDPTANYVKNDIVTVGNTKWRCKIDDTTGVTPAENANWTIYLESATSLAGMDDTDITSPKNGDGLVHDGNDWKNIPIMTKEQWKKNGAYNLCPNEATTQTVGEVTFTVASNGTVTAVVNATTTAVRELTIVTRTSYLLPSATYRMVGAPNDSDCYMYCRTTSSTYNYDSGNGFTFTDGVVWVRIAIKSGTSTKTLTFKPMITTDLNATYADYVPYAKTNRELTEDTTSMNGSATKNGLTFTWAILAKNLLIITISSGSATNAMPSGTHLLDLSDIGLSGRSFLMASQSLYSYPASAGRFSVAANYAYVETNDTVSSGASLRGTIVCVLK